MTGRGRWGRWGELWPALYSLVLALVVVGPLLGPGYLLLRDGVSTPRSYVTDSALGLGDAAPRAVPQDWLLATVSSVVDGGIVVQVILVGALWAAGWGAAVLARRMLGVSTGPQLVAATLAVWNPYVAERLLQGHWSLLAGYAALPWIVLAALRIRLGETENSRDAAGPPGRGGRVRSWLVLGGCIAAAGLTPTGALLAGCVALVIAGRRNLLGTLGLWCIASAPWLVAAALSGAGAEPSDPAGITAFAARAEPGLGTIGALAGFGGIWNAQSVPDSRTTLFALVGTVVLLLIVAFGVRRVAARGDAGTRYPRRALLILAAVAILFPALGATGWGLHAGEFLVTRIPGAGLLRDTQKYVALAMPAFALCAAAGCRSIAAVLRSIYAEPNQPQIPLPENVTGDADSEISDTTDCSAAESSSDNASQLLPKKSAGTSEYRVGNADTAEKSDAPGIVETSTENTGAAPTGRLESVSAATDIDSTPAISPATSRATSKDPGAATADHPTSTSAATNIDSTPAISPATSRTTSKDPGAATADHPTSTSAATNIDSTPAISSATSDRAAESPCATSCSGQQRIGGSAGDSTVEDIDPAAGGEPGTPGGGHAPRGTGLVAAVCIALLIAVLPDLAWGVGGNLRAVQYPGGWQEVAARMDGPGDVAVLPAGMFREFPYSGTVPVLDPAPRMVPRDVLQTGELPVRGGTVAGEGTRARVVEKLLLNGAAPARLAAHGVGWILVEHTSPGPLGDSKATLRQLNRVYADRDLSLYRVPHPRDMTANSHGLYRSIAITAHLAWLLLILGGVVAAVYGRWIIRSPARGVRPDH